LRCSNPVTPTISASWSEIAQPMSSWQRTYVAHVALVGLRGISAKATCAISAPPVAKEFHS
jgi:hypothetical protein